MNERERTLAVLRRERPDRVPWLARLEMWHNARLATGALPERFLGMSLWEIDRTLGVGIRALGEVVKRESWGFETRVTKNGDETRTEYITPVGTLSKRTVYNQIMRDSGVISPYESEHIIRCVEDYDVAEYIYEHTRVLPCYERFQKVADEVGGDGLVMGTRLESPYQSWLIRMVGYENGFAHLYEHTERVERFLRFLTDWTRQTCRMMWESPAELLLANDNLSGQITPPKFFRKYLLPFYQEFSEELHRRGKWLAVHFDGDPAPLLSAFPESGVDVAECFTPAPMTRATLAEAQAAWGDKVIIWGGIPSVVMCGATPDDEFDAVMDDVFDRAVPAGNLILGVGDNVVADGLLSRVERVSALVKEKG